jgi:uncharacterized protein
MTAVVLCVSLLLAASPTRTPIADAAMKGDHAAVRMLLKQGGDVSAAQADGMTALHWSAMHGDAELAAMLLYAGANIRATTRLGGYTPLHLAAQAGHVAVIEALIRAGAGVNTPTATGATALMLAAMSGSTDAVTRLIDAKADVNATESAHGETALMFAAALDRADVVRTLIARGADVTRTAKIFDVAAIEAAPGEVALQAATRRPAPQPAQGDEARSPDPANARRTEAPKAHEVAGVTRGYRYNELIGKQGGLTALHFAARQGSVASVQALIDGGADVNQISPADNTSPLLIAAINGQFDIAKLLLDKGADPDAASDAGATSLYAVLNVQWAPKSFYPQPRAHLQQKLTYLELMTALLDKGADPNPRLRRKIWYMQYNFDLLRVDEGGATPFWRAAYASDVDAMKLLVARAADPNITTMRPAAPTRRGAVDEPREIQDLSGKPPVPVGGPGIPPLQAAAGSGYGEGFAGNAHRFAPGGMLAAVKYLVEELRVDVNQVDHDGNTAVHHAAARGDNEMIKYLVSKGADVRMVNREGQTTVDMANGPVQRIQPFPETIKLLESLGAKNNHKCVSC